MRIRRPIVGCRPEEDTVLHLRVVTFMLFVLCPHPLYTFTHRIRAVLMPAFMPLRLQPGESRQCTGPHLHADSHAEPQAGVGVAVLYSDRSRCLTVSGPLQSNQKRHACPHSAFSRL